MKKLLLILLCLPVIGFGQYNVLLVDQYKEEDVVCDPSRSISFPSWRQAMASNTWAEVGINTLDDINPRYDSTINPNYPNTPPWNGWTGHQSIIIAWCGACFDDNGSVLWLPLGGGHGDYAGNEPYKIDLSENSPTWEMVRPPSGAIGNQIVLDDGQEATGLYSDGRLRAVHSYNKPVYVPQIGPVMTVTGGSYSSALGGLKQPAFISPNTGELIQFGAENTFTASSGIGHAGCYDSTRHAIWFVPSQGIPITYYDITQDSWINPGISQNVSGYSAIEYIEDYDCIIWFNSLLSNGFAIIDCATNTIHHPQVLGSIVGLNELSGKIQPRWIKGSKSIAFWHNSSNTTTINTLSFSSDPRTDTWQISQLPVSNSNTVIPSVAVSQGTYGRFFYSSKLDGFGIVNSTSEKLYFYARSNGITSIQEHTTNKELLKVTDLLGRETKGKTNEPLFYIYDDGTVEKKIILE